MVRISPAELWRQVAGARPWLAGAVAVGLGQAVLLVAQAGVLARLLTGALDGGISARAVTADVLLIASLAVGQALSGWAWEACTEAAARRTRAAVRRRALAAAMDPADPMGPMSPGGMTTLIGTEVDDLDPFVARVLPRTVLALAVPALLLAWIGHLDPISAALAAATLVIAPALAGLVGADTSAAVRRRLASLERLGDRFDALVEGLPLLRAFGRAADHERAVAASGEQVRTATLATLRIALVAGLVLELLTAVGTALVAVRLGLRPRRRAEDPPAGPAGADAGSRGIPAAAPADRRFPRGRRRPGRAGPAGQSHRHGAGPRLRPRPQHATRGRSASSWRECASRPKAGACRCWTGSTCECPPGSGCAWSARAAPVSPACSEWWRVSSRPRRAGCAWRVACPRWAGSRNTRPSCPPPSWTTSRSAGRAPTSVPLARSSRWSGSGPG